MAPSKQDEATPAPAGVYMAGLVSFLLGAILAVFSLLSQPAEEISRSPNPEDVTPGEVVFLKGREGRDLLWQGKWASLQTGQFERMSLDESDLNAWARSSLAKLQKPENPSLLTLVPARVNFRVTEADLLQVGIVFSLPGLTGERTYILQLVGKPTLGGSGVGMEVVGGHLGHAPLGSVPVVRDFLKSQAVKVLVSLMEITVQEPVPVPGALILSEGNIALTAPATAVE